MALNRKKKKETNPNSNMMIDISPTISVIKYKQMIYSKQNNKIVRLLDKKSLDKKQDFTILF